MRPGQRQAAARPHDSRARQCLYAYILFECLVVGAALALPLELAALTPVLRGSYRDGAPGFLFPAIRVVSCLVLVFVPAAALGATFPVAVGWFAADGDRFARASGALYAANTAGAAAGALLAGFVLIPRIGVSGAMVVGIAGSLVAIIAILVLLRFRRDMPVLESLGGVPDAVRERRRTQRKRVKRRESEPEATRPAEHWGLAAAALGLSGFASLMFEIAWTRVFALIVGPTTHAFAATLTALIVGLAAGSAIGSWIVGWTRRPSAWLAFALALAAIATGWTCSLAGSAIPRFVAEQMARSPDQIDAAVMRATIVMGLMIVPTAIGLGAAFPLALAAVGGASELAPRRAARVCCMRSTRWAPSRDRSSRGSPPFRSWDCSTRCGS